MKPKVTVTREIFDDVLEYEAAAQAIRTGTLSSEDLTRALLERIARHENTIQAFQWIDPARALDLARQADRGLDLGEARGPLHGIPLANQGHHAHPAASPPIWVRPPSMVSSPTFRAVVAAREAAGASCWRRPSPRSSPTSTPGKTRDPGTRPTPRADPPAARRRRWPWGFCPGRSARRPTVR